jgi:prepilin-type N-terminal cleavage/methylation domain-containing protein
MIRRTKLAGFTMLEMMVVVAIVLSLMVMLVPMFQVTTKTAQTVQRKLAVYAAARNILDIITNEVRMAAVNERGEHFSIKHVAYLDTDTTVIPSINAQLTPPGDLPYIQSRRQADCVNFLGLQPGAYRWGYSSAGPGTGPMFRGSQAHPLAYCELEAHYPEMWKASIRSSLSYQTDPAWELSSRPNRVQQLNDVSKIDVTFAYNAVSETLKQYESPKDTWHYQYRDEPVDNCAPGNEIRVSRAVGGYEDQNMNRRITGINLMDLNIAYWDENARKFVDQPDSTVIYFSPPPKAVRITITVCDRDKRGKVTLCRVVKIPVGEGDGLVVDAKDSFYKNAAPP